MQNHFAGSSLPPSAADRARKCRRRSGWVAALGLFVAGLGSVAAAAPTELLAANPRAAEVEAKVLALARARAAVVGLRSTAIDDAASSRSLGQLRKGSGIVIDDAGEIVLTIGYLVLEAEQVELDLGDGRIFPARALAYDQATGFGLVQALAALPLPAARLGQSSELQADEPLMIASGGRDGDLSLARLVSKRPYTGFWEYHIDDALFTVPPRGDHPGAGLFNADGELLGIGSLMVNDALGPGRPSSRGNMFVPIDLLKPILGELRLRGSSHDSRRAWLGLNCSESDDGEVRVLRVTADGPADAAGLLPGDQIVAIDGTEVKGLEAFYKRLWTGPKPEREVVIDILRGDDRQTMKVQATDRRHALRRPLGI